MSFSILILTLNEEANLPACLDSVAWCDDVVVLDSFSTDATEAIALGRGARFHQRAFDGFAGQRNHGLDSISFRNPWVFHLDADERFTPGLREECEGVAASARAEGGGGYDGYFVPSRMMFMGRWLRHAACYPTYQMRFGRVGAHRFEEHGHGQREASRAGIGFLREPLIHESFGKGLADWFERHNRYSTHEAEQNFRDMRPGGMGIRGILKGDPVGRRRALKALSSRLPGRPLLKFAYLYLVRLGFMDGRAGYTYCLLQALYESMITLKLRELRRREKGPPP